MVVLFFGFSELTENLMRLVTTWSEAVDLWLGVNHRRWSVEIFVSLIVKPFDKVITCLIT